MKILSINTSVCALQILSGTLKNCAVYDTRDFCYTLMKAIYPVMQITCELNQQQFI